jgi:cobalt-zinc-cadmium efflux system outer membrane protein
MRVLISLVATVVLLAAPAPVQAAENVELDLGASLSSGATRGPGVAVALAPRSGTVDARAHANPLFTMPARVQIYGGARFFPQDRAPGPEIQVQATQEILLRGLGAAREAAGKAQLRSIDADVDRAKLDAAARAGLAWVGAREAEAILALRTTARGEAKTLVRLAKARVTAGTATPHELATAEAELALADAEVLHAEGMLTEALFELRYATGMAPGAPVAAVGDLFASDDAPIDADWLRARARAEHPAVALAWARADASQKEAALVRASYAPSIAVGVVYAHEGQQEQVAAGMLVFPLPWSSPGAFESRRALAAAEGERARAELARDQQAALLELALHEHEHTRAERSAVEKALVPLREATRIARAQYETGTADITPLVVSRQRLLAAEERHVRAAADVRRADIHLAYAAGTLLRGEAK